MSITTYSSMPLTPLGRFLDVGPARDHERAMSRFALLFAFAAHDKGQIRAASLIFLAPALRPQTRRSISLGPGACTAQCKRSDSRRRFEPSPRGSEVYNSTSEISGSGKGEDVAQGTSLSHRVSLFTAHSLCVLCV